MNEIANKFLLKGDKFMPEMQLKQAESTYSAWDSRYEIQDIFTEMGYIKLAFNMIELIKILKI